MPKRYEPKHAKMVLIGHQLGWATKEIMEFWSTENLHPRFIQRTIEKATKQSKGKPKPMGRPSKGSKREKLAFIRCVLSFQPKSDYNWFHL